MTSPQATGLLSLALDGDRAKRAISVAEKEGPRLCAALRRALPSLPRSNASVSLAGVSSRSCLEAANAAHGPVFTRVVATEPGAGLGVMVFDAPAIGILLHGELGGASADTAPIPSTALTSAQAALMTCIAAGTIGALDSVLHERLGVRLSLAPGMEFEQAASANVLVVEIEIVRGSQRARVLVCLDREAFLGRGDCAGAASVAAVHAGTLAAVAESEIELVAELARVRLRLASLARLRRGDVLPLPVHVGDDVIVRAANRPLLSGRPTAAGGRIAIEVRARHEG